MDMKRHQRPPPPPPPSGAAGHNPESQGAFSWPVAAGVLTPGGRILRPLFVALACFSIALVVVAFSGSRQTTALFSRLRFYATPEEGEYLSSFGSSDVERDRLLGGLLAPEFDELSCISRYKLGLLRKKSPYLPSPYLLQMLRNQEALQKKCSPNTRLFKQSIEQLKSGRATGNTECKYVVWSLDGGIGNRMLSLASTFLFALLTTRVILVDGGADSADLFCEPFPESSWLLPLDFPVRFDGLDLKSPQSYGNMLKNKAISTDQFQNESTGSLPSYAYLHLMHDYDEFDKLFFCEDDQRLLQRVPWLLLSSNNYFAPSLFLIPAYEEELARLFPQKDTVFHHLGRYLFQPSNAVWGLILRYYQSYLANYDERLGIQIRVFDYRPFHQNVLDQVLACLLKEKLLPELNVQDPADVSDANSSSKSVLVTSLTAKYSDQIRNMYWENAASTGEIISVHQPSHEEIQQTKQKMHDFKAVSEIYLLSLTDVLVTSSWSTFGYVAQSLGGLKPWILGKPQGDVAPVDDPCHRAISMEPCFHAPPSYDCRAKTAIDTGNLVPHVRHCEDMSKGLKLTNGAED